MGSQKATQHCDAEEQILKQGWPERSIPILRVYNPVSRINVFPAVDNMPCALASCRRRLQHIAGSQQAISKLAEYLHVCRGAIPEAGLAGAQHIYV